ncbi:MAG TPA: LysM peptidoglycan-binding domain-containing protein [Flavobacteriales bacterium]|nr:LysM peptidoglycan-binding domain-containing protein [Flavobacteriales bacterium]
MQKIILVFMFLVVPAVSCFAQPANARIETYGGKEYYVHTVKKGETLSEIAKKYKSPLADVLNSNPGKENRIDIGDHIKIPVTNRNRIAVTPPVRHTTTGKEHVVEHKVEKGETIYGIAKKYKTTQEAIYELNPDAKNGISPGQTLKIQTTVDTESINHAVQTNKLAEPKVLFDHVVLPQETIFSLSRKYNISQDSIKLLNNGLPDGLKANTTIKLAAPESKLALYKSWELNPVTIVNNNQASHLTMVNPADSVANKTTPSVFKTGKKDVYNVGIMIPFMLDKNKDYMEGQDQKLKLSLYEPTRKALDFELGVEMALDSLKKAGINTNLNVFDVTKDSASYKKVFQTSEFKNLDLLIGPFEWIELTAKAAKENKIPMLIPVACSNKVMLDNPFAFKAITTSAVIADESSKFIVKNFKNENIILIDGRGKNDVGVQKSYKKYLNKYYFEQTDKKDSIRTMQLDFLSTNTIENILRKDKMNVLIVPSNDFAYVSSTLSNLHKFLSKHYHKDYKVTVFGTDEWITWDQMDILHKLKCNVHVPSPTSVDFDTLHVHQFIKGFRNRYKTDPDKYGMMGFDLAYFWMAGYAQYGLDFANMVQNYDVTMNQTRFVFNKMNETSGCLNKNVYILKYENYKLIPQKND